MSEQSAFVSTNQVRALPATNNTAIGGIFASLSPGSLITCNVVRQMGYGIKCAGPMVSDIFNNDMQNLTRGIWLDNFGFVGPQGDPSSPTNASQNKWIAVPTCRLYTSNFTNGALSPFYYLNNVQENPGTPCILASSGSFLFVTDTTSNFTISLCAVPPPALIVNPELIAQDIISFTANDSISKYHNKKALFNNIVMDSINVSNNNVLNSFIQNHNQTSIGKLKRLNNMITNTDSLQINNLQYIYNAVTCENVSAHYQKKIIELYLQQLQNNTNLFDSTQIAELRSIAVLCPYIEGYAVYQARAILSLYDPINTEYISSCEIESESGQRIFDERESIIESAIKAYPNPANNQITFEFELNTNSNLKIYNLLGELVYSQNVSAEANSITLNLEGYAGGIYYCEINEDSGDKLTVKFSVVK